jgi:hypothetical protein
VQHELVEFVRQIEPKRRKIGAKETENRHAREAKEVRSEKT